MSYTEIEKKNSTHKYNTRSKNQSTKSKVDTRIIKRKKIPIASTLPKRTQIITTKDENSLHNKLLKKKNKDNEILGKRKKFIVSNNDSIDKNKKDKDVLGSVLGNLFVAGLVEESNKLLKKKRKENKKDDKLRVNESDSDSDSDSGSESESEYDFPKIEGLPKDIDYTEDEHKYIKNLPINERNILIQKEKKLLDLKKGVIPIRFKILNLKNISDLCKQNIITRLDHFYTLESTDNEYHKLSVWVDCLEKMPFDNYKNLPVTLKDNYQKINTFLSNTRSILDEAVFGHNEAKEKIIMTLTKQISNPDGQGVCIGIQGPMGNGKTTLVKEGICKAVGRPFGFIALGGMQDSSYMIGHDYTYEGSKPGKIVEILNDCNCMNPVIYFDELDKISSCPKGEEIENFLCHLTDTSQNTEFQDKYLSRVKLDMSKVIYIFSYNDPSKVNPILLDRLFKIKTEGFDKDKKLKIAKDYLIPRMYNDFNVDSNIIIITDESIKSIIQKYTEKEEGVRNLKRCLETVVSKVNVLRFLHFNNESDSNNIIENKETTVENKETTVENKETTVENKETTVENKETTVENKETTVENKIEEKVILEKENIETKIIAEEKNPDNKIEQDSNITNLIDSTKENCQISIQLNITEKKIEVDSNLNKDQDKQIKNLEPESIVNIKIKNFSLPFTVTPDNLDIFLKSTDSIDPSLSHLYL